MLRLRDPLLKKILVSQDHYQLLESRTVIM
jgi:hypothetical protein